ncbi:MAG: diacylglycerol kinase [Neisseriaceae bacterium]|nr:diacylglycerol kinase [Neisseriaceae bacterium]
MKEENQQHAANMKGKNGIRRIMNACRYSAQGFQAAFKNEAAFRQLVLLNAISIPLILFIDFDIIVKMILLFATLLTLIVELFNTAIEAIVDRVSTEKHPLSKIAKDAGSAAQTMALLILGIMWLVALWDYFD